MKLEAFEMERWQSLWENVVDFNLSESGVHPLRISDLVADKEQAHFSRQRLGYNQTNGSEALRELIAELYPGAATENVLVTNGSAEANLIATMCLLESGDEALVMLPNYMQIWGLARGLGAQVKPFHLIPQNGRWQIDWDELESAVTPRTKLIAICNPNNPTGATLNGDDIRRLGEIASRANAWILSDEVYRGAERSGEMTPTLWGNYEKAIAMGGLSKAYGLPGLRIGWIVAPPKLIDTLWAYHDYTTICPSPLSDALACLALEPSKRAEILARTRKIVTANFAIVSDWLQQHPDRLDCIPPEAGAIAFIRYQMKIDSLKFAEKLRFEQSVLIVPGAHFHMQSYFRIGFGSEGSVLKEALDRVSAVINQL